jgi:hypothetical protein
LIELSIFLIIIGLLIAGVSGGRSLVNSARLQNAIREIRYYRLAFNAFYEQTGRIAGDINNDGVISYSGCNGVSSYYAGISNDNFAPGGEYATACNGGQCYSCGCNSSWVELWLKKLIKFHPNGEDIDVIGDRPGYSLPSFPLVLTRAVGVAGHLGVAAITKNAFFEQINVFSQETDPAAYNYNVEGFYIGVQSVSTAWSIRNTDVEFIDKKIDDGIYNSGEVRGACAGAGNGKTSYESAISLKTHCLWLYFKVLDI